MFLSTVVTCRIDYLRLIIFSNVIAPTPVMCSFMLICQCCFAIVKVFVKESYNNTNLLVYQSIKSVDRSIIINLIMIDRSTDLIDWLTDWLIDVIIKYFVNKIDRRLTSVLYFSFNCSWQRVLTISTNARVTLICDLWLHHPSSRTQPKEMASIPNPGPRNLLSVPMTKAKNNIPALE